MISFLKKIAPKSLKEKIREYILSLVRSEKSQDLQNMQLHVENITKLITSTTNNLETVGKNLIGIHHSINSEIGKLRQEQAHLNQQLNNIETGNLILYQQLPEILVFDKETLETIDDFKKQYRVDFKFNLEISKNDIMFLYSMAAYKSVAIATHNYFTIGYSGFSIIRDFIEHQYPNRTFDGNILDFASGYGRVTRFLASYYGADKITAGEIKTEAVDFQKETFKVNGMYSTYIPAQLTSTDSFDIIFVGSLFSHLNEQLFEEWLTKLLSLLTSTGHLLFTVHDQSLHPHLKESDFQFVENNEDEKFEFITNRITSKTLYGISFVSESFVRDVLKKINPHASYKRYEKTFGGHQDVYVATIGGALPSDSFQFRALH